MQTLLRCLPTLILLACTHTRATVPMEPVQTSSQTPEACPRTDEDTCYERTQVDGVTCWTPIEGFEGSIDDCDALEDTKFAFGSHEPRIEIGDEMCP